LGKNGLLRARKPEINLNITENSHICNIFLVYSARESIHIHSWRAEEMLIDMHNHTNTSSPDSFLSPEELIETARMRGLDALCVTEHYYIEGARVAQEVGKKLNFPVFRGIEATTDFGHMLVYGYDQDIPEYILFGELCRRVHEVGGVLFAAHPYREDGMGVYSALSRKGFNLDTDSHIILALRDVDGLEVINGKELFQVNHQANNLAGKLRLPGIGGSDAHSPEQIARAATVFEQPIRTDQDLIEALRNGQYRAVDLQQLTKALAVG
jgi:hypothetical protein